MGSRRAIAYGFVLAWAAASACTGAEGSAAASQNARQEAQARLAQPTTPRSTFTLEFDAGADVLAKAADGRFVVRAFQVGFFDGSMLVRSMELARERAEITGTRVRLVVPIVSLAREPAGDFDVRVRSLTAGRLGEWSAAAGSVQLPSERASRASRRAAAGGAREPRAGGGAARAPRGSRRALTATQLEQHPALKAALEPQLKTGLELETVLQSFSRPQDLAVAVVVARTHDVPLARICEALRDGNTRSLATALRTLRVPFDVSRAVAAARPEARTLVGGRSRR